MPAKSPALGAQAAEALTSIGAALRKRRKELRVSGIAAAEAAGISRVTLHRIEKGEPSVTMGAYMAVFGALGLGVLVAPRDEIAIAATPSRAGWLPARVRIADYPKLKELAWQVHGTPELTPREALGIYERNWRHLDPATLLPEERDLVDALRQALGSEAGV
jgi:transcriptional regulator with XRE-family HTH domain